MFDNINEQLNDYDTGSQAGGDMFRIPRKKSKSRVRILAGGTPLAIHWVNKQPITCFGMNKGCSLHGKGAPMNDKNEPQKPKITYLFYVLDKSKPVPKVQLGEFVYTVFKAIKSFSETEGYEFSQLPMPYDITISYDPDEKSPGDMYKVIAARENEPVDQVILDDLKTKKPTEDLVNDRKKRQMKSAGKKDPNEDKEELPEEDIDEIPPETTVDAEGDEINPEDIPF